MAASASSEIIQLTDLEVIEVSETDVAFLRELLQDSEKQEESEQHKAKQIVHGLETNSNANADDVDVMHDGLKGPEEMNFDAFEYTQWSRSEMLDMAPNSLAVAVEVDETMAWYVEEIMIGRGEFDCNIDYSMLCTEALFEETAFECLWQD